MILLHRHAFRIAGYHREQYPDEAEESLAQGLVVDVELTFEEWLGATPLHAEAFLDPGADGSILSSRWIREQRRALGAADHSQPKLAPDGSLVERVELSIAGDAFPLGDAERPLWVGNQGEHGAALLDMPGQEDLLIGRDFITQHGLLLLIDGEQSTISLLAPQNRANRERRELILEAWEG